MYDRLNLKQMVVSRSKVGELRVGAIQAVRWFDKGDTELAGESHEMSLLAGLNAATRRCQGVALKRPAQRSCWTESIHLGSPAPDSMGSLGIVRAEIPAKSCRGKAAILH